MALTCMTIQKSYNKPRSSTAHSLLLFAKNLRDFSPAHTASHCWPTFRGFETSSEVKLGNRSLGDLWGGFRVLSLVYLPRPSTNQVPRSHFTWVLLLRRLPSASLHFGRDWVRPCMLHATWWQKPLPSVVEKVHFCNLYK